MGFSLRFGAQDVRVLESVAAFSGHFSVNRLTLQHRLFSGGWSEPITREVFERGDAVGVLPYDPLTDSLVMVEQFRPGAMRGEDSPWMLELIAGVVEQGEDDEQVARREAVEEAGCDLNELIPIATVYPSAGGCSEQVRLYCGRVNSAAIGSVGGLHSEGEDILVHAIAREEAMAMLERDEIPNGHTLIALQWLKIHAQRVMAHWS